MTALLVGRALLYALVASRIAGFVVSSPFPGNYVGQGQRVGLVALLTWVVGSFAPESRVPATIGAQLVVAAVSEVSCGVVMGFAFRCAFVASDMFGASLSQAVGLSMPMSMNPQNEQQDSTLGHVMTLVAMMLALGAGVHQAVLSYVLESFRALPVGSEMNFGATALGFVDAVGDALGAGVRLALPVVATGLTVQVALAMIARAAPALQVFNIGMTVLLVTGLTVLMNSVGTVGVRLVETTGAAGFQIDRAVTLLARAGR